MSPRPPSRSTSATSGSWPPPRATVRSTPSTRALRKAIGTTYPQLASVHLTDFKVRVLDTSRGTGAVTRVLIDSTDGDETWTTIGVSENVIEASWAALEDSIVFGLLHGAAGHQDPTR